LHIILIEFYSILSKKIFQ